MSGEVCLIGNPNTGKSTVFNSLTGMRQHTGNWTGKTVGSSEGKLKYRGKTFKIVDLPGIYSLKPVSADEKYAVDYLKNNSLDLAVIVLDATCLERNLVLALEVIKASEYALVCLNLIDEAKRKNININLQALERELGVRVIETKAVTGYGLEELKEEIYLGGSPCPEITGDLNQRAKEIYNKAVDNGCDIYNCLDRKIDRIVMSRLWGIPIMLGLLGLVFYITISLANIPSQALSGAFNSMELWLLNLCEPMPEFLRGFLIEGCFRTMGWVVSVMLPPMAIFFPLFTLLEDVGYLPRIAFMLDRFFKRANAHGKMVLSLSMGFGCNAVGVTSARIIESPRERLIAILTNSFVPCNGRFPALILLASMVGATALEGALVIMGLIIAGVLMSLLVSLVLSKTLLKGEPSGFVLELPPYRKPQLLKIIYHSITDRTLFVLGRAVAVALPAGGVIWLLNNIYIGDSAIVVYIISLLSPIGKALGMDGSILTAFFLGVPANEIVLPLVAMCYEGGGSALKEISDFHLRQVLTDNGWSLKTAVCTMVFMIFHFPCATTLITIKREAGGLKWAVLGFFIPLLIGIIVCGVINFAFMALG